ncbi:uncharacterized protein LOC127805596 [Diospyros lotus]|uniref:uncharacterized protein LOC127805596 n=1 Tax=Diospyros lotus TaxID=55363 RepID=UPI002256DB5D|nr:uncharacterized protein LOC127805596 [Diospyros lotus]
MAVLHGWNKVTRCKAFPLSLAGQAQQWFTELPVGHIQSFEQLKKEFLEAFSTYIPKKKSAMYLMSLQQRPNEPLKQYIERFKAATQEVRDLPVGLAASALLNGTTYAPLRRSLAKTELSLMTELFARAEQFIVQMEILEAWEGKRRGRSSDVGSDKLVKMQRREEPPKMPFKSFTPLTEPRATILSSIAHTELINFPPHTNQPMGRNMDSFCKFHESPGHTTEQCRELRNQIEQLIREGKLDRFILDKPKNQQGRREESRRNNQGRSTCPRDDAPNRRKNQPPQQREGERNNSRKEEERPGAEDGNEPVMERIHVISGGENLEGDSSSSRKAYARQALHVNSVEKIQEDEDPLIFCTGRPRKCVAPPR